MDYQLQSKLGKFLDNPTLRIGVSKMRGFRLWRGILGGCFAYAMVVNQPFTAVHTHGSDLLEIKVLNRTLFEVREVGKK